jgi:microcystin-dependent protein
VSDPFIGEIQAFPFPFAAQGFNQAWLPCSGQLLPIQAYTALFSLIGTIYGGNGTSNFSLPNMNGLVAINQGQGNGLSMRTIGELVGSEWVTLTQATMPSHTHSLGLGSKGATGATAGPGTASNMAAIDPNFNGFVPPPSTTMLAGTAIVPTGQSQPHPNTQPTQAIVWCIAVYGIFPSFSVA